MDPTTARVRTSMTSIASPRAAKRREPSPEIASETTVASRRAAAVNRALARSTAITRRPEATNAREPSGAIATARVRPRVSTRAVTRFVLTSTRVA
jgi:hypothetical protein